MDEDGLIVDDSEASVMFPAQAAALADASSSSAAASASAALLWPPPFMSNLNTSQFPSPTTSLVRDQEQRFFFPSLPPLPPQPPPPPSLSGFYHDLYARTRASSALQFAAYDGGSSSSDPLGLAGLYMGSSSPEAAALIRGRGMMMSAGAAASPFGALHAEFGKMTPQEIMDAKAIAASRSHSEAERRRRERINAHLARLRSLLPSTAKTDKASLLAEVIQHVKELKRQTSEIAEESPLPTETDELTVDAASDEDGRLLVRASLCCDDRSDLLPDLIKALKALKLRTLKAEITTLAGRIKNVLVITGDHDHDHDHDGDQQQQQRQTEQHSIASIQDALKAVMERTTAPVAASLTDDASAGGVPGGIKRQRTTNLSSILEHNNRSI